MSPLRWLFDGQAGPRDRFATRWIFLRALAAIYFSAFFPLLFQIEGLNGPDGILPVQRFLPAVHNARGRLGYWYAPTVFWFSSGSVMMMAVIWLGLAASVAAFLNLWPRLSFFVCFVCFLSFVSAAQAFSSYQSDSMLLEAGFLVLFFAPRGIRPGWGLEHFPNQPGLLRALKGGFFLGKKSLECEASSYSNSGNAIASPAPRASLFLLQWEWFRIYFESGLVKLLSGDPEWRHFTAMDDYYQNGPLPTWIGYYVAHLPHWFHAATVAGTLAMELGVVWMLFLPRRVRLVCFCIVTPWEIGVILTANYTFLNYLVLALGFLLLDDRSLRVLLPRRISDRLPALPRQDATPRESELLSIVNANAGGENAAELSGKPAAEAEEETPARAGGPAALWNAVWLNAARVAVSAVLLTWIAYATTAELIHLLWPGTLLPSTPMEVLGPLRIANQYGLFAVMTRGRYEIEFQGSNDGQNWTPYPFQFKPQVLNQAPGLYAPYQPRFDWNLWFASLGDWQQNDIVPLIEERLLENDQAVLKLFKSNPFGNTPPRYVRAVLWQYWFTSLAEKRQTGDWWKRELMGLYAPELTRLPDGQFEVEQWPEELPPHD